MKIRNAGLHAMNMPKNTSSDTTPNINYTVTLEEDGDECILPLPDEILDKLDWQEGDILEWVVNDDNTITIHKV